MTSCRAAAPGIMRDSGWSTALTAATCSARKRFGAVTNPSVAVQDYETTLELTYGCAVRPGLLLQPDLQYIIHPGGNRAIPNALAIGVNIVANF